MKDRDRGRDEERGGATPGKDSARTQGREKMRSGRSPSNDATRRVDKEHGGRAENGRRSDHPVNQEGDKEREKDRSSSGKGVEK